MNKIIMSILFCTVSMYAGLVNAIAIIVNDTPITLLDIEKEVETKKVSKNQAVSTLIDTILYDQALSENRISVDIFDIDNYIEKLAANNKMSVMQFKSLVRQQQNYTLFKEQIKKQILHQKLIAKIAGGKLTVASNDDLKIYFNNNKEQFKIADTIDVIAYVSKDKKLLEKLKKNPMMQSDNIMSQNITMKQSELNAQTKYILNTTAKKEFSAIFPQNKNYNMFFVSNKKDITPIKFDDIKEKIFQIIMKKREQDYLAEYFETAKITADIKVLR